MLKFGVTERAVWSDGDWVEIGVVRELTIIDERYIDPWCFIELTLNVPAGTGETTLWIQNDPSRRVSVGQIARANNHPKSIEDAFKPLESVPRSEVANIDKPCASPPSWSTRHR